MSIYDKEIYGEQGDTAPILNLDNIVATTRHNGMVMIKDSSFCYVEKVFIFPDEVKAEYFCKNYKEPEVRRGLYVSGMKDFREGMLKDDYVFHILDWGRSANEDTIYADQMYMHKNYNDW
jgi:hypothetical protein